jgi:hypothetical protein
MVLNDYVEIFNDRGFDNTLKSVFNKIENFLRVIAKRGGQSSIELNMISYNDIKNSHEFFQFLEQYEYLNDLGYNDFDDVLKNYFLEYWIGNDSDSALTYITENLLTDVEMRSDGFWLMLRDREELAEFYESGGRDTTAKDLAKEAFSEEGLDFDRYWDTTNDVYTDVIEELDESNIQYLGSYILKTIGNQDLNTEDYSSDFLHELAEIQARDGFFQITSENVYDLINDSEAMNELMDSELSDLKSELDSVHSRAYNYAYEEEVYELINDGLGEFFSSKVDEQQIKNGDKIKYVQHIKIRDFQSDVMVFVSVNKGYGTSDSLLEYWGSYTGIMKDMIYNGNIDGIDFRIPDYADWGLTKKHINELFTDYI